jgi:sugar lactone lactonase YvrE
MKKKFIFFICYFIFGTLNSYCLDIEAFYPEGPLSTKDGIYWAEMTLNRIRYYDGKDVITVFEENSCGPTCIKKGIKGFWILCHTGHRLIKLSENFKKEFEIRKDVDGNPILYPNDAVTDSKGHIFFTSSGPFSNNVEKSGYVLYINSLGQAKRIFGPLKYANGISYDEINQTLFISEHLARRIIKCEIDSSQKVKSHSIFFDFSKTLLANPKYSLSGPDGQLLFKNGELIVADYGESRLIWITKEGNLKQVIPVTFRFVTNLAISPFEDNSVIILGSFENDKFPMKGRLISYKLNR